MLRRIERGGQNIHSGELVECIKVETQIILRI